MDAHTDQNTITIIVGVLATAGTWLLSKAHSVFSVGKVVGTELTQIKEGIKHLGARLEHVESREQKRDEMMTSLARDVNQLIGEVRAKANHGS